MTAVDRAVDEGAAIVDIGGVKAGPGDEVDEDEEVRRVAPFVAAVRRRHPRLVISVDTWRAGVGRAVVRGGRRPAQRRLAGADPGLAAVAAEHGAGLVCTHAGGLAPRTDPHRVAYDDVVADVVATVTGLAERAVAAGVRRDGILVDPAHDFGKNTYHSLEVTRRLDELVATGWPVLVAVSNKDFVGETLDADKDGRLEGTPRGDRDLRVARRPGLPGAPGGRDPAGARHRRRDPRHPRARRLPPRPRLTATGQGSASRTSSGAAVRVGARPAASSASIASNASATSVTQTTASRAAGRTNPRSTSRSTWVRSPS